MENTILVVKVINKILFIKFLIKIYSTTHLNNLNAMYLETIQLIHQLCYSITHKKIYNPHQKLYEKG